MKKVLLLVIDALASRVVEPAMAEGRLPHLRSLAERGYCNWNSTAIFPSITPAATAALIAGGYPAETGIAGAYFYDRREDHLHYYGDDTWAIMREGFARYFEDFLVRLNRDQLRLDTAYQVVERAGLSAASLNYLWFRGDTAHRAKIPWILRLWPGVSFSKTVYGPKNLSLGDLVSTRLKATGGRLSGTGGLLHRFGFTDEATAEALVLLIREGELPAFTTAYFPDNDFVSHDAGPQEALHTVEGVDAALGQVLDALGGLDRALESLAVLVTGDHAQSDLPLDAGETGIRLDKVLRDYTIVPAGREWRDGDELMICPNMRAAQVYLRPDYWLRREEIVARLLDDPRIDQVIWRQAADAAGPRRFRVATGRQAPLDFWPATSGEDSARDEYGGQWSWRGDLGAVDGRTTDSGQIEFGEYPNAFERIAMAFDDEISGDLWVTSCPGYEFRLKETGVHRRGSHGSLHALDSLSPLIAAGVPRACWPQQTPRSIDVAPLCLSILGLSSFRAVGASSLHTQRIPEVSGTSYGTLHQPARPATGLHRDAKASKVC